MSQPPTPAREPELAIHGATIDAMGGSFTMPCTTVAVTAARASR